MATSEAIRKIVGRSLDLRGRLAVDSGDLGTAVRHSTESGYVAVVVLLMILFCLLLPLLAMLYFDTMKIQKKAERTEARIEKLLKELEKKENQ